MSILKKYGVYSLISHLLFPLALKNFDEVMVTLTTVVNYQYVVSNGKGSFTTGNSSARVTTSITHRAGIKGRVVW